MIKQLIVEKKIDSPGYTAIDLTPIVVEVVGSYGLVDGIILAHAPESRTIVTMIEYEPELLKDLEDFIEKLESPAVAEALLGKSVAIPVENGELSQGVFKHIVFIDLSRVKGEKRVVFVLEGSFREDRN
ncbi:YjbQ family protein [Desulfurococcaceae archaeon MEX13E-LK6-19]|nr:YjbQ family protein [Desulfurococcaceae archaeon MEX13E-LK6-19]